MCEFWRGPPSEEASELGPQPSEFWRGSPEFTWCRVFSCDEVVTPCQKAAVSPWSRNHYFKLVTMASLTDDLYKKNQR